jgi:hypothetical protein
MYNQQRMAHQSNGPAAPAPAQTPTEYATSVLKLSGELNSKLTGLRYRLYGEGGNEEVALAPDPAKEASLESLIQASHYALCRAIEQLEDVHRRL